MLDRVPDIGPVGKRDHNGQGYGCPGRSVVYRKTDKADPLAIPIKVARRIRFQILQIFFVDRATLLRHFYEVPQAKSLDQGPHPVLFPERLP